jgi:hypothetical protein
MCECECDANLTHMFLFFIHCFLGTRVGLTRLMARMTQSAARKCLFCGDTLISDDTLKVKWPKNPENLASKRQFQAKSKMLINCSAIRDRPTRKVSAEYLYINSRSMRPASGRKHFRS